MSTVVAPSEVTDAEIREWVPLVWSIVHRLHRQNKLVRSIELEDFASVGLWAVWDALRTWDPDGDSPSRVGWVAAYVWRYVMHYQRDATKAEGWDRHKQQRVAVVNSYDAPPNETDTDLSLLDTLAGPHDVFEHAYWCSRLTDAERTAAMLVEPYHSIARAILDDQPAVSLARRLGFADQRAAEQRVREIRSVLAGDTPMPDAWRSPTWQLVGLTPA